MIVARVGVLGEPGEGAREVLAVELVRVNVEALEGVRVIRVERSDGVGLGAGARAGIALGARLGARRKQGRRANQDEHAQRHEPDRQRFAIGLPTDGALNRLVVLGLDGGARNVVELP